MTKHIPQYTPLQYDKHGPLIEERLRTMAERSSAFLLSLEEYRTQLRLPCSFCHEKGYVEGTSNGTCEMCKGMKSIPCAITDVRRAYKKLRKQVCKARGFTPKSFDTMVRKSVGDTKEPMRWFTSARIIAASYGVPESNEK